MPTAGQRIRALDFEGYGYATDTANITTTATTYTLGTAGQEVGASFTAPSSGTVYAQVGASQSNSGANTVIISVEVREGSTTGGSAVFSAHDDYSHRSVGTSIVCASGPVARVTGLTPGSTYTAWAMHYVSAGTGNFFARTVAVWPAA